jgi:hypothetical protein
MEIVNELLQKENDENFALHPKKEIRRSKEVTREPLA